MERTRRDRNRISYIARRLRTHASEWKRIEMFKSRICLRNPMTANISVHLIWQSTARRIPRLSEPLASDNEKTGFRFHGEMRDRIKVGSHYDATTWLATARATAHSRFRDTDERGNCNDIYEKRNKTREKHTERHEYKNIYVALLRDKLGKTLMCYTT